MEQGMTEKLRIVITGAVGAGKTTCVRTISEIEMVSTDRRATDETASSKHNTTVAFDFGKLTVRPNQVLYLYGTPGQPRFDFMWDILIRKAHAYLFLVDVHHPQMFRQSRQILSFINQRTRIPRIIGLTHRDCEGAWEPEDVALALGLFDAATRPPLVSLNTSDRHSVIRALLILLQQLTRFPQASIHSVSQEERQCVPTPPFDCENIPTYSLTPNLLPEDANGGDG
jgi:signal recognition particle receptor subunit beta